MKCHCLSSSPTWHLSHRARGNSTDTSLYGFRGELWQRLPLDHESCGYSPHHLCQRTGTRTAEAPQALRNLRSPRWQRIPKLELPKKQEPPIADNEKNSPGGSPPPHSPGQYPELPLQCQRSGPVSYKLRTRLQRD